MNRLTVNLILRHRAVTRCIPKTTRFQNRQFVIQQSCKITNSNIEEESFGTGSKYAQLDTANSTEQQSNSSNKKRISIDSDKFKSNYLNDNEYYSKIGYKKPLSDIKYDAKGGEEEQEEIERNYEKILKHKPLSNDPNKREHTERYYSNKILDLFRRRRHKEAIDVFFVEMIEKDRFKPSIWLYKVMMRELAYIGDIDTVFSLFKRMIGSHDQEWKLPKYKAVIDKIITILFTACAKTNDAEFVIRKCNSIRTFLKNKGIEMNRYHYISAISAYGRSGAIYEAFNLVDEMLKDESVASAIRKRILSVDVFNNMLCACISQPEYGFRYALMTWQMCLTYKIKPNLTTYELLLKAAKDCTMCSSNELVRLNPSSNSDKPMTEKETKTLNIEDQTQSSISSVEKTTMTTTTKNEDVSVIELKSEHVSIIDEVRLAGEQLEKEVKNLEWWQDIKSNVNRENLARAVSKIRPELKEIILARNFDSILTRELDETDKDSLFEFITQEDDTPSGRLFMCTGGLDGFLTAMRAHSARPSLKTFQLLARIVPDDLESENELIDRMRDLNIDMDIDFINALIRRRAFRGEKTEVDDAFNMIQKEQLTPNIHTFGGLAYCLGNKNDLIEFLENLESFNLKLNPIILSTLFLRASRIRDIGFTKYLLDYISQNNVGVNQKFIDKINSTLDRFKKNIIEYERSSNKKNDELETKTYERTRNFYNWLSGYYPKWVEKAKKL